MLRVLGCITEQHDLRLVVLAGLVCFFASFTAMGLVMRARDTAKLRLWWVVGAGVVAGSGIWATHFVAMLAFQGEGHMPITYDLGLTLLSIVIAVAVSTLGFAIVRNGMALAGGAVVGVAIAAMHYTGMSAVHTLAEITWDATYVISSIVLGVVIAMIALQLAAHARTWPQQLSAAAVFTLAICAHHFTAMAAVTLIPISSAPITGAVLAPTSLAVAVAATALLIVGIGFVTAVIDRHLESRAIQESERLRAYIAELEATKEKLEQTSTNLATALEAADAGNRAKSSFLAAMSHELRTPLNAVIGFSEMIKKEIFGPLGHNNYREYIADVHACGTHLLELINNILDVSHLDGGGISLQENECDLGAIIADVLKHLDHQAQNRSVHVVNDVCGPIPVWADSARLHQAILNILANAIKFTPAGGKVMIDASRQPDGLTLTVTDSGIGMSESEVLTALERFGQVDGRLSRKFDGVGLGLPLAKQLLELHGGKLTIESAPGSGTKVQLALPLSRCRELRAAA
jgi:signal transduction histidine kinase